MNIGQVDCYHITVCIHQHVGQTHTIDEQTQTLITVIYFLKQH